MASVHVIGAGPAGSVAAISALREGHNVEISEEHLVPGLPTDCSGLISRDGLSSLSDIMDYRRHAIRPMHGAILDFAGHKLTIDAKKPVAYVIDRASFDSALAKKAEEEGANLNCGERISSKFRGECIIGADGPNSSVARRFHFPKIKRFAITARCTVKYDGENPDFIRAYLSNKLSPGFFSWVIPHDEEMAEMGTGLVLPGNPLPSLHALSKLTGFKPEGKMHFALIPLECRRKTSLRTRDRTILLAGDAAGQVKSTTGGGVYFGTSCARLAGRHATHPEKYEKEWRSLYHKDLRMHRLAHLFYGMLPDSGIRHAGNLLSFFGMDEYLAEKQQMDKPTHILDRSLLIHAMSAPFSRQKTI
jgi:geranylgeranyl reductase family protein